MHLGESSQGPSAIGHIEVDCGFGSDYLEVEAPPAFVSSATNGGSRARSKSITARSASGPSQSQTAAPHKVRGPNWTEAEMLVLIAQKRIEWDGRHNCSQPSLARFVYGTTAWKLVLAGCMGVVGFRARDTDQITNKWDGLVKDYIDSSGSGNWWALRREEKKQLSKTRKMSLEFSESMYAEWRGLLVSARFLGVLRPWWILTVLLHQDID